MNKSNNATESLHDRYFGKPVMDLYHTFLGRSAHAGKIAVLLQIAFGSCLWSADPSSAEHPSIDEDMSAYKNTEASGVVAALRRQLDAGQARLEYRGPHGYLKSLLENLGIPVSSQLLIASKTSPSRDLISPKNPRALYFNDAVHVAYVPSANLIEIAADDPALGVVFYTLEQKPATKPKLFRDDRCLECHASSKTLNIPGLLIRSFLTRDGGEVDLLSGLMVNHRTPIADRWGGYYVTGKHGAQAHRGNIFGDEAIAKLKENPSANGNILTLDPFLDTKKYPEPGSDIVALMTLEHQAHMQNLLTRLNYEARQALKTKQRISSIDPTIEAVLKYMLFVEEAPLVDTVKGTSEFTQKFQQQGPKDGQGRSLRDFDLETRLFKYPCSYMIYSESFDAIAIQARRRLYRRLWQVLTGADQSADYQGLSSEARKAIREILVGTKPDIPAYWRL